MMAERLRVADLTLADLARVRAEFRRRGMTGEEAREMAGALVQVMGDVEQVAEAIRATAEGDRRP